MCPANCDNFTSYASYDSERVLNACLNYKEALSKSIENYKIIFDSCQREEFIEPAMKFANFFRKILMRHEITFQEAEKRYSCKCPALYGSEKMKEAFWELNSLHNKIVNVIRLIKMCEKTDGEFIFLSKEDVNTIYDWL